MGERPACVRRMVFLRVDALRHGLGLDELRGLETPAPHEARGQRQRDAAGHIHVTADGGKREQRLARLRAVLLGVDGKTPHDRGGGVRGEGARRAADDVGGDPRDFLGPFGRRVLHALGKVLDAEHPVLAELMIVEVLAQNDVEHGEAYGRVGTRTQLQMVLGACAEPGEARIDHDELRSPLHEVHDGMAVEAVGVGLQRALAPEYDVLRHLVARVVVAIREVGGVIELGVSSAQKEVGDDRTRPVARSAGHGKRAVRRLEAGLGHRRRIQRRLAPGSLEQVDGLGPVVLPDLLNLGLEDVERLVPGDALPRILAAIFLGTLHGVLDAIGAFEEVLHREAPRAQTALADRMVGVALDLDELAVLVGVDEHTASHRMAARRRPSARAGTNQLAHLGLPLFIHSHRRSFLSARARAPASHSSIACSFISSVKSVPHCLHALKTSMFFRPHSGQYTNFGLQLSHVTRQLPKHMADLPSPVRALRTLG